MKKISFLLVIMAMCVSFAAQAQETSRTIIISTFSSRAVKVDMSLFYKMATDEAKSAGFSLVQSDETGKMTGFMTLVSTYDADENAQCIKIRIAQGKDMTILSFFNGWAEEVNSKFTSAGGYTIKETEETVNITKDNAKLVLNKADFAKSILSVVENVGWNEFGIK